MSAVGWQAMHEPAVNAQAAVIGCILHKVTRHKIRAIPLPHAAPQQPVQNLEP